MAFKWKDVSLFEGLFQAFFLCGFPVGASGRNHRTIEFFSNFLEFFWQNAWVFWAKVSSFWQKFWVLMKTIGNFCKKFRKLGRKRIVCNFCTSFLLQMSIFLYFHTKILSFRLKTWVFAKKVVRNHRNIEFWVWKSLSFFQRLSFFCLEFLRKRT